MWPASKLTQNRYLQGVIMVILGIVYMTLAGYVWLFVNGQVMTNIGLSTPFVTNVIFLFAVWIFWLGYWPGKMHREEQLKQPWMGFVILIFAVMTGYLVWSVGIDIPWIWFPLSIIFLLLLEGWPVQKLEQPGRGIVLLVLVGLCTWIFELILNFFGISFFTTLEGPTFTVIFVFWTLAFVVYGNLWPFRKFKQPAKGFASTIIAALFSLVTYYLTVFALPFFGVDMLFALTFWAVFVLWQFIIGLTFGWWFFGYAPEELSGEPAEV
jgi:hypothetical protein